MISEHEFIVFAVEDGETREYGIAGNGLEEALAAFRRFHPDATLLLLVNNQLDHTILAYARKALGV